MLKTLLATAAVVVCCWDAAVVPGAQAQSWRGTIRDNSGGSYRVNGNRYRMRVNGTTGRGSTVHGSVNRNGTFSGTVNGQYVTCSRYSCY